MKKKIRLIRLAGGALLAAALATGATAQEFPLKPE